MPKSKKFNLKPNADEIINAGQICGNFLKSLGLSESTIQSQIMILKELIKNGIRCGNCKPSEDEISVHLHVSENTITLEVKNPVDETCCQRLQELDKTIQFIRGYQDPFEAYQKMQIITVKQSDLNEFDPLALSKIAYKGKAILDFYVSDDKTLNQSAIKDIA